jgi:hypothetical protein
MSSAPQKQQNPGGNRGYAEKQKEEGNTSLLLNPGPGVNASMVMREVLA